MKHQLRALVGVAAALGAAILAAVFLAGAGTARATAQDDAIARALEHVRQHPGAARANPDHAFAVRDVVLDADGAEHVRLDRTYRGLRVLGGDLVVHGTRDGSFTGVSQELDAVVAVSTRPGQSGDAAARRAASEFAGQPGKASAELVVWAAAGAPVLAYEVLLEGTRADDEPSELHVVVDASTLDVLYSWDGIRHVGGTGTGFFNGSVALETTWTGSAYRLTDPSRGNQFTCDMRNRTNSCYYLDDADNRWGDGTLGNRQTTAVDAQYGTADTWDYYRTVHGRLGIRNDGRGAYNRVHYSRNYANAFWSDSCFCMTYGDGDGTTYYPFDSLDVAGHEMTHGVTSRTAGLVYSGESGGLNEATSDIFGTIVEFYANNSRDAGDYKVGEKLYRSNPGETKALRYMWQPSLDGKSANCWYSGVGSLNVHYSSGVGNHFFYLLAEGSNAVPASPTCNGSSVTGIGRAAAGRIWYRALTVYMTSSTNYAGARQATLRAAADLYGSGSGQHSAVASAWSAVSVN